MKKNCNLSIISEKLNIISEKINILTSKVELSDEKNKNNHDKNFNKINSLFSKITKLQEILDGDSDTECCDDCERNNKICDESENYNDCEKISSSSSSSSSSSPIFPNNNKINNDDIIVIKNNAINLDKNQNIIFKLGKEGEKEKEGEGEKNTLNFLMELACGKKKREIKKNIVDSDDEYDDNFNIFDNDSICGDFDDNYIIIDDDIKNINDIILLGEKFKSTINFTENSSNNSSDNNFFTYDNRKYNLNLEILCNLIIPLKKLARMVGLENVKKQIFETIIYYLQGFENKNKNMMHSIIEGPPGVGKTRLGKILAQIFCAMKIIPSNNFKYVRATDMIGDHVGFTKHMTQNVIDEADGGVLFIDEAYSLSTSETKDPYGKECIDTLNYNLSENRKKLIVIIAGYSEQLEKFFFSHNPGLKRRFPFKYSIEKYSGKELAEIFKEKLKCDKWKFDRKITDNIISDFFEKNISEFKNFGGDIENFLKICKIAHSIRTIKLHPNNKKKISFEDILEGFSNFKNNRQDNLNSHLWKNMFM